MALTVENLCGLLIRSRLQSPDAVKALYQRWEKEAKDRTNVKEFCRWLVNHQYVTDYQCTLLNNGHADNFFISQYKILDRIGKGRMAGVYKAVHISGQVVAIKVLPPSKSSEPQIVSRFQREAKLGMQLNHPSVVRTYQVGEENGLHFMVMECLDGITIEDLLKQRKRLPPKEAVRIAFLGALGLQHVHEKGMVHRDVKPGNLMLVPAPGPQENSLRSMVKILDIGLGRTLFDSKSREAEELTSEGAILGTPNYLSPEQARDARKADIRSDIYSLGCTLYHAIAGQPPFDDENPIRLILRHASEQPRSLKHFNRDVPDELDQIIIRMMAKDPAERYETPAKVADALKSFLASDPDSGRPKLEPAEMKSYLEWLRRPEAVAAVTAPVGVEATSAMFPLPAGTSLAATKGKPPPSAAKLAALKLAKRRLMKLKQQKAGNKPPVAKLATTINVEPVSASDLAVGGFRPRDLLMLMLGALSVLGVVLVLWTLSHRGHLGGSSDDGNETETVPMPTTYDGEWAGQASAGGYHVRTIVISKSEFPCDGKIETQAGSGQVLTFDIQWEERDGQVFGVHGEGENRKQVAKVKLADGMLSGEVTAPVAVDGVKELSFSQFKKRKK